MSALLEFFALRAPGRGLWLGAACALQLSTSACATIAVRDWGREQVCPSLLAVGYRTPSRLLVQIRNVRGHTDGTYGIEIPVDWTARSRGPAADGVLELIPPLRFALRAEPRNLTARCPGDPRLLLPENSSRWPNDRPLPVGAQVTRTATGQFQVILYGWDPVELNWVRLGTADVGAGSRSATLRAAALAALPFAGMLDLVLLPPRLLLAVVRIL